jgi:hypothetical protein
MALARLSSRDVVAQTCVESEQSATGLEKKIEAGEKEV